MSAPTSETFYRSKPEAKQALKSLREELAKREHETGAVSRAYLSTVPGGWFVVEEFTSAPCSQCAAVVTTPASFTAHDRDHNEARATFCSTSCGVAFQNDIDGF